MYRDVLISPEDIGLYGAFIPECYHEGLKKQEIFAIATFAPGLEDDLVGVVIMGVGGSRANILWFVTAEGYEGSDAEMEMIYSRVRDAEVFGDAEGISAEFPISFGKERFMSLFGSLGFATEETVSNVVEFPLGSINKERLHEKADHSGIMTLKETDTRVLHELGNLMANDSRNIAIEIPVEWDRYDGDLSLVHMDGHIPVGLILVTRTEDHVCVELAYEHTPKGILRLVSVLVSNAEKHLSPDTKIVIPVLEQRIFGLLKVIAPKAVRGGLLKASMTFEHEIPVSPAEIETLLNEPDTPI
ncbi:MAG: hypothetical protein K6E90_03185 [Lachnospiraceae bacterium]|nr:hypothetical protein [Lachnospiraceae bacterium]